MRSLSRLPTLCILLVLCNSTLLGQNWNPVDGVVINVNGDTIYCKINLESELNMSVGIEVDTGDGYSEIPVADIDQVFIPENGIRLERLLHSYTNIEDDRTVDKVDYRLGQLLIDGPVKLYRLPVSAAEYFELSIDLPSWVYYITENESEDYLKLEVKERQIPDQLNTIDEEYKARLKSLFSDYPNLAKKVEWLSFTDKGITRLTLEYTELKYGEGAGVALGNRSASKVSHRIRILSTYNSKVLGEGSLSNNLGFGYSAEFQNPLADNSLTLGVGIEYFTVRYKELEPRETLIVSEGSIIRIPIRASFSLLRRERKIRPFLSAGLNLAYLKYQGEMEMFDRLIGPGGTITTVSLGYSPIDSQDFSILFGVGAGVEIGRLFLEASYEMRMNAVVSIGYQLF